MCVEYMVQTFGQLYGERSKMVHCNECDECEASKKTILFANGESRIGYKYGKYNYSFI